MICRLGIFYSDKNYFRKKENLSKGCLRNFSIADNLSKEKNKIPNFFAALITCFGNPVPTVECLLLKSKGKDVRLALLLTIIFE